MAPTKTSLQNIISFHLCYFAIISTRSTSTKTIDKLPRNQIGRSSVQVTKENKKFTVVCSRSPQNLEFDHFTLLLCRGWQRKLLKLQTHVQSDWFLLIEPFVLRWRCRCRRCRVFVRSLLNTNENSWVGYL